MLRPVLLPLAWDEGIAWALRAPGSPLSSRRLRAIDQVRAELRAIADWRALVLHSGQEGLGRAEQLAERDPDVWMGLDAEAVTAAAYGLRYVELMTGRDIDPTRPLPYWLREWTTR